jgi:RNA polymerase sigma factor (sigma-70 family)
VREPGIDDDSFSAVYREHYPALMRVAFLMTGSNETAEDVVQDTFVRCRLRIPSLDHPASYLRAAVVNECRSVHRRSQRTVAEPPNVHGEIPTELLELQDALIALPWRQRAAIVLRYFVDVPDGEIARTLGCRPSTVRSLVRRGIETLREVLT